MTLAPLPVVADPAELAAVAHRLAAEGLRLRAGAGRLARTTGALGAEGWSGPAAQAFSDAAEHLLAAGGGAAELLARVEAALQTYAGALEAARAEQERAVALGLVGLGTGPAADALAAAQARLHATLLEAVTEAHALRHRLAAATPPLDAPALPLAPTPLAAPPAHPAPAAEAVLALSALAALLASPGDPTAAGTLGPVRTVLAGPLRLLLAPDEQGWHLAPGAALGARSARRTPPPADGTVAAPVAAAVLTPIDGGKDARDGWRLPERG